MKNKEQKYATKVFNSLKSAESFKARLGDWSKQTIKQDKLGRYKVRWLIDKSRPKERTKETRSNVYVPDFHEHWKF
jgi:hypothetical protein